MTKLTTLQMRTLIALVSAYIGKLSDFTEITQAAINVVNDAFMRFPKVFASAVKNRCIAFTLSYTSRKAVESGMISVIDYLKALATVKRLNSDIINDFGAFGDLFEILVRLAFIGNVNLFKASHLHVHDLASYDIISRKYGKIEIGCNGKTFASGVASDFMYGDYNAVVYGVFNDIDKQAIYNACESGNIEYALQYVKAYTCLWTDKYAFQSDMDNLTRGKGITIKSGKIMIQYNKGKYNAFVDAIESGKFIPLSDIL